MRYYTCAVCARDPLTVCALHLPIVACLYETDISQVEDTADNLKDLSLVVTWDPNHLHGLLGTTTQKQTVQPSVCSNFLIIQWKMY